MQGGAPPMRRGGSGGGGTSPRPGSRCPSLLRGLGGSGLLLFVVCTPLLGCGTLLAQCPEQRLGGRDAAHELHAHALELLDTKQARAGLPKGLTRGWNQTRVAGLDL